MIKIISHDLNNVKYNAVQNITVDSQTLVNFITSNFYTIKNVNYIHITFYDTAGILMSIPNTYWLVVADKDNTELYVLNTDDYNKMFTIGNN